MGRQKDIVCKVHGPAEVALACRHVTAGIACGWHTGIREGKHPDAWCDRCDEQLANRGEWTLEMARQQDMAVTCAYCYDLAKQRNRDLPAYARGKKSALTEPEQRKLREYALERIAGIQESARQKLRFDEYARWDFDEGARTLAFTDPDRPTLVADVRLVGGYDPGRDTWAWAWTSHAESGLLIAGLDQLRMFGEVRAMDPLVSGEWPASLSDAWEMTGIAGYLLACQGVYRADFDDRYWFMLLSNWRQSRRGRTSPGGFIRE